VWRRECVALRVAAKFTGGDVAAILSDVQRERGTLPAVIQCDNVLPTLSSVNERQSYRSCSDACTNWMRSDAIGPIARRCFHQHEDPR
jgi:hypothetical protein